MLCTSSSRQTTASRKAQHSRPCLRPRLLAIMRLAAEAVGLLSTSPRAMLWSVQECWCHWMLCNMAQLPSAHYSSPTSRCFMGPQHDQAWLLTQRRSYLAVAPPPLCCTFAIILMSDNPSKHAVCRGCSTFSSSRSPPWYRQASTSTRRRTWSTWRLSCQHQSQCLFLFMVSTVHTLHDGSAPFWAYCWSLLY